MLLSSKKTILRFQSLRIQSKIQYCNIKLQSSVVPAQIAKLILDICMRMVQTHLDWGFKSTVRHLTFTRKPGSKSPSSTRSRLEKFKLRNRDLLKDWNSFKNYLTMKKPLVSILITLEKKSPEKNRQQLKLSLQSKRFSMLRDSSRRFD